MIRRALPGALLIITGCSPQSTQNVAQTEQGLSADRATAILSCSVNGTPIGVSACFVGGRDAISGNLKVKSGESVKQYTDYDLASENGLTLQIPLSSPFEIDAQSISESGYVLRVIILRGTKKVFEDETSELGVMSVSSDDI